MASLRDIYQRAIDAWKGAMTPYHPADPSGGERFGNTQGGQTSDVHDIENDPAINPVTTTAGSK